MATNRYKEEKLEFVSNLNGTSFSEVVGIISLFPMINFIGIMLKVLTLYSLYDQKAAVSPNRSINTLNPSFVFW
jgi:hypothetical protein